MQYADRILDELRAVGFNPTGFNDGEPYGDWEPDNELITALCSVHIPDETTYLATDLTATATALQSVLGEDMDKWEAYLEVQTTLIRNKRYTAYIAPGGCNDQYHEIKSDGGTDASAKSTAGEAKQAIKSMFPWPGTYR